MLRMTTPKFAAQTSGPGMPSTPHPRLRHGSPLTQGLSFLRACSQDTVILRARSAATEVAGHGHAAHDHPKVCCANFGPRHAIHTPSAAAPRIAPDSGAFIPARMLVQHRHSARRERSDWSRRIHAPGLRNLRTRASPAGCCLPRWPSCWRRCACAGQPGPGGP